MEDILEDIALEAFLLVIIKSRIIELIKTILSV